MKLSDIQSLLSAIQGCTFAALDAETMPKPGLRCVTTGERVILFTNKNSSGYDNMVRRRLEQVGKDPDLFRLGDLPWGERVPETPMITHNGKHFIQCIVLTPGEKEYFLGKFKVDPLAFGIRKQRPQQGLPKDMAVIVHTYDIENITRLSLLGETIVEEAPKRKILTIR